MKFLFFLFLNSVFADECLIPIDNELLNASSFKMSDLHNDGFLPYGNKSLVGTSAAYFYNNKLVFSGARDSIRSSFEDSKKENFYIEYGYTTKVRTILAFKCNKNTTNVVDEVKRVKTDKVNSKRYISIVYEDIDCSKLFVVNSTDIDNNNNKPYIYPKGFISKYEIGANLTSKKTIDLASINPKYKTFGPYNAGNGYQFFFSPADIHDCPFSFNCLGRKPFSSSFDVCLNGICNSYGVIANDTYGEYDKKSLDLKVKYEDKEKNRTANVLFKYKRNVLGHPILGLNLYKHPSISENEVNVAFTWDEVCLGGMTKEVLRWIIIGCCLFVFLVIIVVIITIVLVGRRKGSQGSAVLTSSLMRSFDEV